MIGSQIGEQHPREPRNVEIRGSLCFLDVGAALIISRAVASGDSIVTRRVSEECSELQPPPRLRFGFRCRSYDQGSSARTCRIWKTRTITRRAAPRPPIDRGVLLVHLLRAYNSWCRVNRLRGAFEGQGLFAQHRGSSLEEKISGQFEDGKP